MTKASRILADLFREFGRLLAGQEFYEVTLAVYRVCRQCAPAVLAVVMACSAATTYAANKKSSDPGTITAGLKSSPRKIKAQNVKGTLVVRVSTGKSSVSTRKTAVKAAVKAPARSKSAPAVSKTAAVKTSPAKAKTTAVKSKTATVKPAVAKAATSKVTASKMQKASPIGKRWVEQKKIPMVKPSKKKEQLALNLRKPLQQFRKQISVAAPRAPVVRKSARSDDVGKNTAVPLDAVQESTAKNILQTAFRYLKTAYRVGGSGPSGFDCSGFTHFIYGKHGISLPRSSVDQAQKGSIVAKRDLKPGDLVFFSTFRKGISHVGIFIANGLFIHSAGRGKGVSLDSMFSRYWASRYRTARRVDLRGADQIASADGDKVPFAG